MRHPILLALGIGLTVIGLFGLVLVQLVGGPGSTSLRSESDSGANAVDAMFIEQMVPHHQDAIDMAELASSRASRPEIRELAANVERNQSEENAQMRAWYEEWFGTEVPDVGDQGMMGGMMSGTGDLDDLREADDFDREFIEQMVPHHEMGIMMAQMARRSAARPELQRLTESIIEQQSREVGDMQRWYREWYGRE